MICRSCCPAARRAAGADGPACRTIFLLLDPRLPSHGLVFLRSTPGSINLSASGYSPLPTSNYSQLHLVLPRTSNPSSIVFLLTSTQVPVSSPAPSPSDAQLQGGSMGFPSSAVPSAERSPSPNGILPYFSANRSAATQPTLPPVPLRSPIIAGITTAQVHPRRVALSGSLAQEGKEVVVKYRSNVDSSDASLNQQFTTLVGKVSTR